MTLPDEEAARLVTPGYLAAISAEIAAMVDPDVEGPIDADRVVEHVERLVGALRHERKQHALDNETALVAYKSYEHRLAAARVAAKALAALIDELGDAVDDDNPAVMLTAAPIGAAEADLFMALGIYEEAVAERLKAGAL